MTKPRRIPLRRARTKAHLTQAELAAKIGKRQNFISRLETGEIPPPRVQDAEKIGAALGVDHTTISYGRAS